MHGRTAFGMFAGCWLLTAAVGVRAQRFDNVVRDDFFAGITGDSTRFDRAMKTCEEALAANVNNAPALVWHGAGLLVRSGQSFQAGKTDEGLELHRRAMREMDRAVGMAPDDIQVLIPRAAILAASARFSPGEQSGSMARTAAADYEKVLAIETLRLRTIGVHPLGELLGGLATAYRLAGDNDKAISYLQRVSRDLPGTPYDKKTQAWLADLRAVPKEDHFCLGCHAQ